MTYPPNQKPPIWSIDPGVIAYNCQKAGMPHPVLAMPMWEGAGTLARDYSGRGNHGMITGADWGADGLNFGGSDYINLGTVNLGIGTGDYTVCIRFNSTASTSKTLISFENNSPTIYSQYSYDNVIGLYSEEDIDTQPGGSAFKWTDIAWVDNEWTDLSMVRESGVDYLYLNSIKSSQNVADNETSIDNIAISIGRRILDNDRHFVGTMANVQIFNTALSAPQDRFLHYNPYFMYQIPEELYGYVAGAPPTGNPFWYYNMLRRRN